MMRPIEPTPYSKDYEITDAMFGAFRSPGGAPFFWKLMAWFTLGHTLALFLIGPIFVQTYIDLLIASIEVETSGDADQALASMGAFFGTLIPLTVLWVILHAVIRASFFRGYFFGETEGRFPFRLGADEWRQVLAILGYYAVVMLIYLLGAVLVFVLVFGLGFLLSDMLGAWIIALMSIVAMIGLLVLTVFAMVVFAPAGALTALRGKTHVLAARHVSKGRFWAIFGSALVAGLIGYVVYYVLFLIGMGIAFAGVFDSEMFAAMMLGDTESTLEGLTQVSESIGFRISVVLACILISAGMAFYALMLAGPQAFFTRQWAEAEPHIE